MTWASKETEEKSVLQAHGVKMGLKVQKAVGGPTEILAHWALLEKRESLAFLDYLVTLGD